MVRNVAIALCLSFAAAAQQPAGAPATQTAPAPAAAAQAPAAASAAEKAAAAAPAAEKAPADPAISADGKMHLDAAVTFLKAWGKGRWDDARPVAADKVAVKLGDKSYDVDVAGGKSEVKAVLPFRGLRAGGEDGRRGEARQGPPDHRGQGRPGARHRRRAGVAPPRLCPAARSAGARAGRTSPRSEEHTSEL